MKRKRNITWIHRRSRSIMAGIATLVLLSSLGMYANAKNSVAETTPGGNRSLPPPKKAELEAK